MKVERVDSHFLRKLIVSVVVAVSVLFVSSGGPFGDSHQGLEAQTPPAINLVSNLTVSGTTLAGSASERIIGNIPNSNANPTAVRFGDVQSAVPFTTGDAARGYTITEIKLMLATVSSSTGTTPVVTLHEDDSGVPADAVLFTFTNPDPFPMLTVTFAEVTFTGGAGYEVDPSTTYHIRLADTLSVGAYDFFLADMTNISDEVALADSGWEIGNGSNRRVGTSGTWAAVKAFHVHRIGINGFVLPGVTVDTDSGTDGAQNDELTIVEGMTATYTVALTSAPSQDVMVTPTVPAGLSVGPTSLTFSATDFEAKTFTITANHDNDLADAEDLEITHEVSGYGTVTTADPVTVDVTDDDAAGITVTPTTMAVSEGATEMYTVVLDFQPANSVTVTPAVTANRGLTLSETSLTFSTSNWDLPQSVTVTAAEDTNNANETATITHSAAESGAGTDYNLTSTDIDDIAVTVNDNETLTLSVSSLILDEGVTASYTVVLARAPSSTVTVTLSLSSDIGLTVDTDPLMSGDQHSIMFTVGNWSNPQTVDVTVPADDDGYRNTGTITHTSSGGGVTGGMASLTTTVEDKDVVGVVLGGSATYNTTDDDYDMTVGEGTNSGSSNEYTVKLASQPFPTSENVTVTITAPAGLLKLRKAGASSGSKTASLMFTGSDWNTAQTVTVIADEDADSADNTGISVSHVATGAKFDGAAKSTRTLNVTVTDDDSPNLIPSATSLDVVETNGTATAMYTLKLATQPSAAVTVTLTQPTNTDVTVAPNTLTFTSSTWDNAQTVTVSVAADADAGDETAAIVHSVSQTGGDTEYNSTDVPDIQVVVRIDDDESASVTGPVATLDMVEDIGGSDATQTFTLRLGTPPTSPVTITMEVAAVEPAQVPGNAWTDPDITVTQSVVLDASNYAAGQEVTITLGEDDDAEDDVARINYTVTQAGGAMEYDGFTISPTTVNISDPETPVVLFRDPATSVFNAGIVDWDMEDGGSNERLYMRLSHRPRGAVTVSVVLPPGSGLSVDKMITESFTETAFGSQQTDHFRFAHEGDDDAYSQVYTLDFTVSGYGSGTVQDLNITVVDKDDIEIETEIDMPPITVEEGAFGSYNIFAFSRPSTSTGGPATVSIAITSNNADVTVSPNPAVLNSNNWENGVEVTVSTRQDADGVNDVVTLSHVATSVSGGQAGDYDATPIEDVTVTVDGRR